MIALLLIFYEFKPGSVGAEPGCRGKRID